MTEAVDPFRQLFLSSIQTIIRQDPDYPSLLQLLQTVVPTLTSEQVFDSADRNKAFRLLKLRIHPDKHPSDLNQATKLFQDVQEFFNHCCKKLDNDSVLVASSNNISKKRKATREEQDSDETIGTHQRNLRSTPSPPYPVNFTVFQKWDYMTTTDPTNEYPKRPDEDVRMITSDYQSATIAFRCLNARGAIAHGKKISHGFSWDDVKRYPSSQCEINGESSDIEVTISKIFQAFGGGSKILTSVSKIKDELLHHGPVVSQSFTLSSQYLTCLSSSSKNNPSYYQQFVKERVNGFHEMLIVGWALTTSGEVWLCQPLIPEAVSSKDKVYSDNTDLFIPISMGQFGFDVLCTAPKRENLDHLCWQVGPYFDVDFKDTPDWREWGELELPLVDMELKGIFQTFFPGGFAKACSEGSPIVLRDKNKIAHSDTFVVTDLKWVETSNEWFMTLILKP